MAGGVKPFFAVFATLLAELLSCVPPALAQEMTDSAAKNSIVASHGLVLTSASGALLEDEDDAGARGTAHVSFGRALDFVGVPIDLHSVRRPVASGARGGTGQLPGVAAMPVRWPLISSSMTSGFGLRRHPIFGDLRAHSGVDLAAAAGTPVYASAPGYVVTANWAGGYGLLVAIEHAGGMQTRYGHLARLAVASGQYVAAGAVIGYVGSTGNSTGPHLHYEVRINGRAVNPLGQ